MPGTPARLGTAVLIALAVPSARADVVPGGHPSTAAVTCRDVAEDVVSGINRRIFATMEITGAYAPPYHAGGWDEDEETYTLSTGMVVLESCFEGLDAAGRRERAREFSRAHGDLLRGLQTCAHSRHLPPNPAAIYERLQDDPPEITCDADKCGDRAGGCWQSFPQNINIKVVPAAINGNTLFHELLHATGRCGNQDTEAHNVHSAASDAIDEVTFWEDYCFRPDGLLAELRNGHDRCETVMSHDTEDNGEPYTAYHRTSVCGYLREYNEMEDRYLIDVTREVLPAALTCDSGHPGCGDAEDMNERLIDIFGAWPGEEYELPAPGNIGVWLSRNCGTYMADKRDFQKLINCADAFQRKVSEKLFEAGRDPDSPGYYGAESLRERFNNHMLGVTDQLVFYANNIARTNWIPSAGPSYMGGDGHLVDTMENCMNLASTRSFARTGMCQLYRERYAERAGRLFTYWGW